MSVSSDRNIRAFWERTVERAGDQPFVQSGDRSWTYAKFDRSVNELANGLVSVGVREGDFVALFMGSSVELLRLELAIQKVGAVMVPLISGSTAAEASHVLGDSGARFLVCDQAGWDCVVTTSRLVEGFVGVYIVDNADGPRAYSLLESGDERPPAPINVTPNAPASLMYTSGSTSKPKGVLQPQRGFVTAGFSIADRVASTPDDRWMCVLPLFHTGQTHMMVAPVIASAASLVLVDKFVPAEFWDISRQSGSTLALVVPTILSLLQAEPPSPADKEHNFRQFISHIRPPEFVKRFGVDIATVWAMTETCGLGTMTTPGFDRHENQMIGWAFPEDARVQVIDALGAVLPAGESGQICFRHPDVMLGYHNDPDNTMKTLVDGWVRTGDLGRVDEEGRVFFEGRLKNVIKRSGENIAGEEVEFALLGHPRVVDCIVTAVPDPVRVEEVHATVAVGADASLDEAELAEWLSQRISRWKVPRYIQFARAPLPRLANGKINRSAVIDEVDVARSWDRSSNQTNHKQSNR